MIIRTIRKPKPQFKIYTRYNVNRITFLDESILKYIRNDLINPSLESRQKILSSKIDERIKKISIDYDNKINQLIDNLILYTDLEQYSIDNLGKLVKSVTRVTKSLSNSLASIVIGLEDIK